jgi:hypothetical protein
MVQKEELRIGNLLKPLTTLTDFAIVEGITDTGVFLSNGSFCIYADIEPIKITAEILEKSEFTYGRKYSGNDFYDIKKAFNLKNEVWEFKRNNTGLKYLEYVHQAQNLFYFLSGEELKINFKY